MQVSPMPDSRPTAEPVPGLPLSGLRVLDLTRVRSGPAAARQFADWGADVIKIEPTGSGDVMGGPRDSGDFQNLQRNKRSLQLDLKSDEGLSVLRRIAAQADIVIENFRPDVKTRLGIDYDSLSAENPGLIYASISGFGQDGPYANRAGFDQIAQGMGGLMSITGLSDQGPVRAGAAVADMAAGLYCTIGILTALHERSRSGRGQWVHTSLLEAQIALLDFQAARWLVEGEIPARVGNDHPTGVPTGVFPTSDGEINIAVWGEDIWRRFCAALDLDWMRSDPRYDSPENRRAHRAEINADIAETTRRHSSAEWLDRLEKKGVPCGPIYAVDEMFTDPQVRHLQMAAPVTHPSLGEIALVAQPINFSRAEGGIRTLAPDAGAHSREILREFGYSDAEVAALISKGVV